MDKYALSHVILTMISSSYPGGSEKFEEEGGLIAPLPPLGQCLIYHPNPPEEFKKALHKTKIDMGGGLPDIVFSFIDRLNFEGMSQEEISGQIQVAAEELSRVLKTSTILISPNPVMSIVMIPGYQFKDGTDIQDILDILVNNIDNLIRLLIVGENGLFPMDLTKPERVSNILPEDINIMAAERNIKTPSKKEIKRTIRPDDIINLRIDLEVCNDAQEFIDRM